MQGAREKVERVIKSKIRENEEKGKRDVRNCKRFVNAIYDYYITIIQEQLVNEDKPRL